MLHHDEALEFRLELSEVLDAPVHEGEKVGEVIGYLEGEELCRYPIVLNESVEKQDMAWCFSKLLKLYLQCK